MCEPVSVEVDASLQLDNTVEKTPNSDSECAAHDEGCQSDNCNGNIVSFILKTFIIYFLEVVCTRFSIAPTHSHYVLLQFSVAIFVDACMF